ncbi:ParA family protein [Pseudonocardia sp. Ae717_Ps2]|uniref:AAA family ATPase n=1 Tax=Pseudonocardia sp. Ae717_Ps2 TaxID=1885573 RepID=UPI0018E90CC8
MHYLSHLNPGSWRDPHRHESEGGSTKTTSSAFLAHALAENGHRVLIIDADPQASITRWAEMAEWSIPVRGMATGRLHVPGVGVDLEAGDYDAVVIDTPPPRRNEASSSQRSAPPPTSWSPGPVLGRGGADARGEGADRRPSTPRST